MGKKFGDVKQDSVGKWKFSEVVPGDLGGEQADRNEKTCEGIR